MSPAEPAVVATFAFYLALMLGIGLVAYRRTLSVADYLLGGRRLNRWVTALSAQASDMSGWLLLGLPGYAYLAGLESVWLAAGLLAGTWLNWRLVAGRLRRFTAAAGEALTIPDYLERRFGGGGGRALRAVSALFILFFFYIYTASGLVAGGKLFSEVFGLPYGTAVLAGAAVVVVYTFLGGFLAVAWTDVLQGGLMFVALLVVPLAAVEAQGGWGVVNEALAQTHGPLLDLTSDAQGHPLEVLAVVSLLAWGLGYFGQPHILVRFMAVRSEADLPAARRIGVAWATLGMAGAILAGLAALPLVSPPLAGADAEKVFIRLVALLFHPVLAGVWLAAILAAIMSTADSQLLVASSALAEDVYRGLLRPGAASREVVLVSRGAVLLVSGLAVGLALDADSRVLDMVAYAWAGFGAAFGPVLVLSLYWRRMTRGGAVAGVLAGGATVLVWRNLEGGLYDLYEMVPGVLAASVAVLSVSLLQRPPGSDVLRYFDGLTRSP